MPAPHAQLRIRIHDAITAATALLVCGGVAWITISGIRARDYAYDLVAEIVGSITFGLVLGSFVVAPIGLASVLARVTARPWWLAQLLPVIVFAGGCIAIFTSDSSTAVIGLLFLPFYAGLAALVGAALHLAWHATGRRLRRVRDLSRRRDARRG